MVYFNPTFLNIYNIFTYIMLYYIMLYKIRKELNCHIFFKSQILTDKFTSKFAFYKKI